VLLRPLPYEHSDRIVRLLELRPNGAQTAVSTLDFLDWSANNTVFDFMAACQQGLTTLSGTGDGVRLRVGRVTARYFDIFGERPFLGRTFADGDDPPATSASRF
jgi:putative ABC transport system permease protein